MSDSLTLDARKVTCEPCTSKMVAQQASEARKIVRDSPTRLEGLEP